MTNPSTLNAGITGYYRFGQNDTGVVQDKRAGIFIRAEGFNPQEPVCAGELQGG
jgi:hypothetical protein